MTNLHAHYEKTLGRMAPGMRQGTLPSLPIGCSSRIQQAMAAICSHLDQIKDVAPTSKGCEECLKMGDRWVHLRMCLLCGHVGCCDSSKNKHATRHYGHTGHPLMRSIEPGEEWGWCYEDEVEIAV